MSEPHVNALHAESVTVTPVGSVAATDVQAALAEISSEVQGIAGISATELGYLDGVTAGTVLAGKAVVTTTDKHIDALAITAGGLALGAGAGTPITATAAEINLIDGSLAGTSVASKALALGANKETDVLALPVSGLKIGPAAGTAVDRTAAELNALAQGVAAGYRVARGVAAVTGTATVATGLTTVVAITATAQDDLDGDALAGVSATIGDQAGSPAAGSVILKCWKVTTGGGAGNPTLIAANAAKNVNWIAVGT